MVGLVRAPLYVVGLVKALLYVVGLVGCKVVRLLQPVLKVAGRVLVYAGSNFSKNSSSSSITSRISVVISGSDILSSSNLTVSNKTNLEMDQSFNKYVIKTRVQATS